MITRIGSDRFADRAEFNESRIGPFFRRAPTFPLAWKGPGSIANNRRPENGSVPAPDLLTPCILQDPDDADRAICKEDLETRP